MSDGTTFWVVLGLVALVVYGLDCWFYPYKACRKCGGTGRFWSPLSQSYRMCPYGPSRAKLLSKWMGRG